MIKQLLLLLMIVFRVEMGTLKTRQYCFEKCYDTSTIERNIVSIIGTEKSLISF